MAAINIDGLTKRFGDIVAVDNLDLCIEEGEVFRFLGLNGAGKSTTIDILLDFIQLTEGTVTIVGHDAQREAPESRSQTRYSPTLAHLPIPHWILSAQYHGSVALELTEIQRPINPIRADNTDIIVPRNGVKCPLLMETSS